jgi:CRP/FNR family transcriptional regulator
MSFSVRDIGLETERRLLQDAFRVKTPDFSAARRPSGDYCPPTSKKSTRRALISSRAMTDKIAAMRRTQLFGELPERELTALAERAVELRLAKGELLLLAGEQTRGLYVVVEGSVRAFRESLEGREQVIHVERAGATIAEVPAFDGGLAPSSVAAEEPTVLLFIDKRDIRRLCVENPEIALAALGVLAGRLRRCSELVAMLSLQDVGQRLARFLLAEARARGKRSERELSFSLHLTKEQIAVRVGSVREVVSRAFGRMQQEGLLRVEGKQVVIPDEDALARYAGQ